ncbi:MAG TPA: hypothetical protein VK837_00035 [Longimicrobiales bacterium]|nr:hypothetical protein [Longimicrobiales bacterium]
MQDDRRLRYLALRTVLILEMVDRINEETLRRPPTGRPPTSA